jgi:iron complex transport system ATP-binding protein
MNAPTPILACRDLALTVPGRTLCRELAFTVHAGEFWVVVGRNGSGKTTLLQTLAGLRAPAQGAVLLAGAPIADCPPRRRAQRLGFLPQDTFDAFPATVLEIALGGRHPHIPRWRGESAADPAILLLDEPTNHLDIAHEVRSLDLLATLARERGRAVVMALHGLTLAARYATHAVLLDGDRAQAGPASTLLTAEKLSSLFGQALVAIAHPRGTAFLPA